MESLFDINLNMDAKTKYEEYIAITQHKNRTIYLNAGIDGDSAYDILTLIHLMNDEDKGLSQRDRLPIKIYIDSPGGSVISCFQIIDSIKLSKTPVWTIATGGAYSAGGLILLAGHKRIAYPNASFLWHEGSMRLEGDVGKMKNLMAFNDKLDARMHQHVVDNTKITMDTLTDKLHDDWWMTPEEMLEYGVVDEIAKELI